MKSPSPQHDGAQKPRSHHKGPYTSDCEVHTHPAFSRTCEKPWKADREQSRHDGGGSSGSPKGARSPGEAPQSGRDGGRAGRTPPRLAARARRLTPGPRAATRTRAPRPLTPTPVRPRANHPSLSSTLRAPRCGGPSTENQGRDAEPRIPPQGGARAPGKCSLGPRETSEPRPPPGCGRARRSARLSTRPRDRVVPTPRGRCLNDR